MIEPIPSTNPGWKHGLSHRPEYRHWNAMRDRCYREKATNYYLYGARGIKVCKRWNDFELFLKDMGERPTPSHTIERKNVNGNYEPNNCYWATPTQQGWNKRNVFKVTYQNETKALAEWCYILKLDYNVVVSRIKIMRWSVECALETPTRQTYEQYLQSKRITMQDDAADPSFD